MAEEYTKKPSRALLLLLKAFGQKDWAEEFLDGCLYCNTLRFHREREDREEGAIVIPGDRISELKLRIQGDPGSEIDMAPDTVSVTHHPNFVADYINVFCMYSWMPPFEDEDQVVLDKETQLGSLRELEEKYGPHAVVIRDLREFFNRLSLAVEDPENKIVYGMRAPVKYELLDSIPDNRRVDELMKIAFHKNRKYASEQEYRFAFSFREKHGPRRVNMGSIRDIAGPERTTDIYDSISVNGSNEF